MACTLSLTKLLSGALIASVFSTSAYAQVSQTIVREGITRAKNVIIANSVEDLALQEEINRIRAYNQSVNRKVGIFDDQGAVSALVSTAPSTPIANKYAGRKIELFTPQTISRTQISYTNTADSTVDITPAPATTVVERRPVLGETHIHRVVKGDNLFRLSQKYCTSQDSIKAQNSLSDNGINLGQVLAVQNQCAGNTLPASTTAIVENSSNYIRRHEPIPTSTIMDTTQQYAVLKGDAIYGIAKRYCLKAQDLADFNNINDPENIQPGQMLNIPANACR
ncbi:MAG: LysM peptidoglycan-binding domain-containing protein [Robiginitomaculum sp.]